MMKFKEKRISPYLFRELSPEETAAPIRMRPSQPGFDGFTIDYLSLDNYLSCERKEF